MDYIAGGKGIADALPQQQRHRAVRTEQKLRFTAAVRRPDLATANFVGHLDLGDCCN